MVANGASMAGKIRNLVNRSGRYHARLVVPKDLRGIVGKAELRMPLGGDYRAALKLLPGAVTQLQNQIAQAERQTRQGRTQAAPARYPLAPDQIALSHYTQRLWLVDRKIAPHIPVFDKSGRSDGTWPRADFEWDAENNQYICPEGQELKQFRRNYSDPNRGPTGKGVAKYRCLKHTCQACPSKSRCCPNMDFRSITREEHEDARQVARDIAKTEQYVISMTLRKKVEMLFAHLKRILGLNRLRLRGPCGAKDEFLLAATAQNLRKLAKILPAPQQMRNACMLFERRLLAS